MDKKRLGWKFFISLYSEEQLDDLINQLRSLKPIVRYIEQHEEGDAKNLNIKLESKDFYIKSDNVGISISY